MLHSKISAAAAWAADQPCMLLDRRQDMWKLVAGYAETSGKAVKRRLRPKDTGICSIIGYAGNDNASPDVIVVEKEAALELWTRCLAAAAASPWRFSTDASVARALHIGSRTVCTDIVHNAYHAADTWCAMLFNRDILAFGTDLAAATLQDRTARRIRKANRAQEKLTFTQWSAQIDATDDDVAEPPTLRPSNWRHIRGRLTSYLYCVWMCAQPDVMAAPGNDAYAMGSLLTTANADALVLTAERAQMQRFHWPIADATRPQRLFEEMMCRMQNGNGINLALAQDVLLSICSSETVNSGDWSVAEAKVAEALPGNVLAAQLAAQLWGAPALLESLHGRTFGRARTVCHLSCVVTNGLDYAKNLALTLKMPWQQRILGEMAARNDDLVTVQPADAEPRRPTALQLGASVRAAFPDAKEGLDYCIVWSMAAASSFALVLPRQMWSRIAVGETATILASYGRKRCTLDMAKAASQALTLHPECGLQAVRLMLGHAESGHAANAEQSQAMISRIDALLRMWAPTTDRLVQLCWQSLERGAGDAIWTILETALCFAPASVHLAMPDTAVEGVHPPWIRHAAWWNTFFSPERPNNYDRAWEDAIQANRRVFGRSTPIHDFPDEYAASFTTEAPTKPGAFAVAGIPVPAQRIGLATTFGAGGVIRTASHMFDGSLHLDLLDAALDAVGSGAPYAADARRWMRNIRIRTNASRIRGLVRVPDEVQPPKCTVGFFGTTGGDARLLETTSVSLHTFSRIFPGIASVFAMKRGATLERARQVAIHFLAETAETQHFMGPGISLASFPVRPGDVVGTLPECRPGLNSDEEREQSQRDWLICDMPRPFPDIPRPLADLPPGTLEVVLSNFYRL